MNRKIFDLDILTSPNYYRENQRSYEHSNNIHCGNCGKEGHTYRRCRLPITSCGVILFKKNKFFKPIEDSHGNIKNNDTRYNYLLIQRRDTLGYVEFLRGKYEEIDTTYLLKLFEMMTICEIKKINLNTFDELWNNLWMNRSNKLYQNEYETSKKKFNFIKNNKCKNEPDLTIYDYIIKYIKTQWEEKEWGFPKGRRNLKESDYDCAIREFQEETGVKEGEYYILKNIKPVEEIFYGSNNIRYKHIYYIAECLTERKICIDPYNQSQITEIGNIKWFNLLESTKKIRPYNKEKIDVIIKINKLLLNNNC